MPKTDPEDLLADLDEQKAVIREQERRVNAVRVAAETAAHDKTVRDYWQKRAKADPDDPEVLRARADLIAADRGRPNGGTAVTAEPAQVTAEGTV